jgi:DNA helicase HerA-like ATPase
VLALSARDLTVVFGDERPGRAQLGRLHQDDSIAVSADVDALVRKHFAVIGSTGAGKSSSVVLLLHQIIAARKNLRVVLIDLHDEYGHCFGDRAYVARLENLRLPYWLFTFDEFVQVVFGENSNAEQEIALLSELIPLAKDMFARGNPAARTGFRPLAADGPRYTVDSAAPYRMTDLLNLIQTRMGKLENSNVALAYQRLLTRLETVRQNQRYAFIFDDAYAGTDCMAAILTLLLHLRPDDPRTMTVFQLARFPSELLDPVVSLLFRLVFEFGLWSGGALPVLLVCEEAHRYANADRAVGFRGARDGLSRIAKEGRKYGVAMGLVSQRPSELDATLISQCNSIFALRLTNEADQSIIRAAVHDPADRMLGFLPALSTREALAFGDAVPMPMRLRFRELPADALPQSHADLQQENGFEALADPQFVARVVARWRGAPERAPSVQAAAPAAGQTVPLWSAAS